MPDPATPGRLVVVSNRIADDRPPAGGLVFALHACLSERGGTWIGSAADTVETPSDQLIDCGGTEYRRFTFEMSDDDHAQFYLGYANSVLWPLCHGRVDLLDVTPEDYAGYRRVNARLARMMAGKLAPEDTIWIHDYHFLPLARDLRALGLKNRIGLFLHIPFPSANDLPALTQAGELLDWLAAFDLVGLQAQRDVAQCLAVMRNHPGAELLPDGSVRLGERITEIRSFPIGIDAEGFAEAAAQPNPTRLNLRGDEKLIIGVDRLDYSKGLVNRFEAFGQFLDTRTEADPLATFLQIAPSSRSDVAAYQEIRQALEQMAGSVNGAHAELDWTPIRYIRRHLDRDLLAPLYRRADAAIVTPLADGMNLVAKEYVAAQDPDDPGVLILSRLAGAAEQLDAALLVNPYDINDLSGAIRTALRMPLQERRERNDRLRESVFGETIFWWIDNYLDTLTAAPRLPRLIGSGSADDPSAMLRALADSL